MFTQCYKPYYPEFDIPGVLCFIGYWSDRLYALQCWLGIPEMIGFYSQPGCPAGLSGKPMPPVMNCLVTVLLFVFFPLMFLLPPPLNLVVHYWKVLRGNLDDLVERKAHFSDIIDCEICCLRKAMASFLLLIWAYPMLVSPSPLTAFLSITDQQIRLVFLAAGSWPCHTGRDETFIYTS